MQKIEPTPFQARLLAIPETYNLFLGGGRGGGKSYSLAFLILRHVVDRGHTARVLVTRRRLKSLIQFGEELRWIFKNAFGSFQFSQADNVFRVNGGTVQLAHCEDSRALADVAQGMSFSLILVDEAGEGPPIETIDQLGLSLRGQPPLRIVLAANPAGVNHSTLAERYVTGRTPWLPFEFANRTWVHAPSTVEDNPHLPIEYRQNFEVLRRTDASLYQAHRLGDWSAIVGDFFRTAWSPALVFDHHEIPPDAFSDLRLSIDWGSAAPCATVLGGRTAYDVRLRDDRVIPSGAFVIYDEHVEHDPNNMARGTGRTPAEVAPRLIDLCHRNGTAPRGVIDSAASARMAGANEATITQMFRRAGVQVFPAPKGARVPRFELLKQMMVSGELWVAGRCRFWLATVPGLPRSPVNPEDVDTSANDHALDATSYLVAAAANQISSRSW